MVWDFKIKKPSKTGVSEKTKYALSLYKQIALKEKEITMLEGKLTGILKQIPPYEWRYYKKTTEKIDKDVWS